MKKIITFSIVVIITLLNINNKTISSQNITKLSSSNTSKITIKFQDEFGNKLAKDISINGYINEEYNLKENNIPGYYLIEILGNKSGIFLNNDSIITYIYKQEVPHTNVE